MDALNDPSIDTKKREELDQEIETLSQIIINIKNQQLDIGAKILRKNKISSNK